MTPPQTSTMRQHNLAPPNNARRGATVHGQIAQISDFMVTDFGISDFTFRSLKNGPNGPPYVSFFEKAYLFSHKSLGTFVKRITEVNNAYWCQWALLWKINVNTRPSCVSPSFVMIGHSLVELEYFIPVTFLADIYECKH